MDRHQRLVSQLASKVKEHFIRKEHFRISHGSTNSTRPGTKRRVVDISQLRNVLKVDTSTRTALVEPNVPMDRLVEATLPHGLVPPVVMEFPGITVGGGYAGTAGESSSFKHGFFDRTINQVEMVLADGEVVNASDTQNRDLFRGAAGALGTLGITTLVELQLMRAKKYVKTTYHPTSSTADAITKIQAQTKNPENDYVDGILFSPSHGAIITGSMTDDLPPGAAPRTFSNPWDPWFYLHVASRTSTATPSPVTEYIPLAEYLFRYDRGGFWVGRSAFAYMRFPFNALTRWFLDDFLHTRMLYRALHASGEVSRYIVQDVAMPPSRAEEFIDFTDAELGIWPLWLCPLKQSEGPTMHPHTTTTTTSSPSSSSAENAAETKPQGFGPDETSEPMLLNIGLWGPSPSTSSTSPSSFLSLNLALETKLRACAGKKWLYAHTYYPTAADFWSQYDEAWYRGLRRKYRAESGGGGGGVGNKEGGGGGVGSEEEGGGGGAAEKRLPDIYDKVYVDVEKLAQERERDWRAVWPLGGVWGIWKAIGSGEWRRAQRGAGWRWKG